MREAKFRGKSKSGYWVTGYLYVSDSKNYIINKGHYTSLVEVFPESIGQFTGLQDVNGKDIYEGDILDTLHKLQIEFIQGSFGYWLMFDFIPICNVVDVIKVLDIIGNIYENPELLEQGRVVTQES